MQGQRNNDDDISFIHIQLVCASVGVTVCVCLCYCLCECVYHLSVCGRCSTKMKNNHDDDSMQIDKQKHSTTRQRTLAKNMTATHTHTHTVTRPVCVCVGVAATGRLPNDLDKNNCAVIIIKSVFGHSTSPAESELRFSNHLMQMVAILYVVHSRNGTPTLYMPVCFSLSLALNYSVCDHY